MFASIFRKYNTILNLIFLSENISIMLYHYSIANFVKNGRFKNFIMGLFDFIGKMQKKIDDLQKRIESSSFDELDKQQGKKQMGATSQPAKRSRRKSSRPILSAADQIIAQRNSLIMNGFKRYEFIANSNCCSVCGKLNGKHFSLQKLEIGVNAPPMHEGCCCSIAAWESRKEYDEWLDSLDKGGTK